jgi:hypothetical protein
MPIYIEIKPFKNKDAALLAPRCNLRLLLAVTKLSGEHLLDILP